MDKTISNTNKDLKIAENNLRYLAKASAVLSASLDYKKTLQTIAKLMVPDIADWCGIDILDEHEQLQSVAVAHKDPEKVKWAKELRQKQGPMDMNDNRGGPQVLRSGKPMYFPKLNEGMIRAMITDKEELRLIGEIGLSAIIIVPLRVEDKNVGTISLIRTGGRYYSKADLEMAIELANRASLAMTNASLYLSAQQELNHRIRLEEALRDANEELENRVKLRTAELASTNTSLERSNQELQDFAYVASHDLQEPLRKIQAFGNLLETEYGDKLGEGVEYVTRMQNAARRMSALIEDILSFSRVTTKGREFTSVRLRDVVQEVLGDLEMRIAETRATIEIGKLPTIHADAMQMRQLLQNLIANALKFHKPGEPPVIKIKSSIITGLDTKTKFCKLEVSDNGLGFEEKYANRIFAVFQRLHSREDYDGTGIGLAICRKIAERHGGLIMAKSKPGKGSTFIVTLPMKHKKGEILI
jgi:signal transduction histidine kinase